jgi:hypothetical protein
VPCYLVRYVLRDSKTKENAKKSRNALAGKHARMWGMLGRICDTERLLERWPRLAAGGSAARYSRAAGVLQKGTRTVRLTGTCKTRQNGVVASLQRLAFEKI